jgi:hypothetical protein
MKKKGSQQRACAEDSLARYDWACAQRGRYAGRLRMGTPVRRLDDDLAEMFPDSASVNAALRAVVALGRALPRFTRDSKHKRGRAA